MLPYTPFRSPGLAQALGKVQRSTPTRWAGHPSWWPCPESCPRRYALHDAVTLCSDENPDGAPTVDAGAKRARTADARRATYGAGLIPARHRSVVLPAVSISILVWASGIGVRVTSYPPDNHVERDVRLAPSFDAEHVVRAEFHEADQLP